jgi:type IV pilus assembly protein PilQ
VEWKDVGIMLEVKPQVTNDKRVFLEIKVEKSSRGENVETTDGTMFSINTSRADTKVLIADGETTVIGGISEETKNDSIPDLEAAGWCSRTKRQGDKRN